MLAFLRRRGVDGDPGADDRIADTLRGDDASSEEILLTVRRAEMEGCLGTAGVRGCSAPPRAFDLRLFFFLGWFSIGR
jgi:hypothetical protein